MSKYKITIEEAGRTAGNATTSKIIYQQEVNALDIAAVIDAVNLANRLNKVPPVLIRASTTPKSKRYGVGL